MKKILTVLGLLIFSVNSVQAARIIHNAYRVYDVGRYSTITEYSCSFRNIQCSVEKVKMMQTGRTFYDSECTGDKFDQGTYRLRAASDVRNKTFNNCKMVSRSVAR